MRLFFAINFPPDVRDSIHSGTVALRTAESEIRWVRPAKIHLTLRFIGDADEAAAGALSDAAADVARGFNPFELTLAGVGGFPNLRRPRVVWIGVESNAKLELMRHDLELRLAAMGYETEGRPFRPHVTIGRARGRAAPASAALHKAADAIELLSETEVTSLDLMNSIAGARDGYDCVHSAPLGR